MATLTEKISDLNDLVLQGKAMEAFEKYYHPNVVMQEWKDGLIIREKFYYDN